MCVFVCIWFFVCLKYSWHGELDSIPLIIIGMLLEELHIFQFFLFLAQQVLLKTSGNNDLNVKANMFCVPITSYKQEENRIEKKKTMGNMSIPAQQDFGFLIWNVLFWYAEWVAHSVSLALLLANPPYLLLSI